MVKRSGMIKNYIKKKKFQSRWTRLAAFLSILVFGTVVWRLTVPVITMSPDPICGYTEHIHDGSCYTEILTCGMEENEEHSHGGECYSGQLTCGMTEHVHGSSCYPAVEAEVIEEDYQQVTGVEISSDTGANNSGITVESVEVVSSSGPEEADSSDAEYSENGVADTAADGFPENGEYGDAAEAETEAPIKLATVTFRIQDAEYTEDAANGSSHLAFTKEETNWITEVYEWIDTDKTNFRLIEDGELYWISGTGDLFRIQIPEGTSFYEQAIRFPELTVLTQDGSRMTYRTDYRWMNGTGEFLDSTRVDGNLTVVLRLDGEENILPETENEIKYETEAEGETETEAETELMIGDGTKAETENEAVTETEFEAESATESEMETEAETEPESENETESEPESETETESESESESEIESESESELESETETIGVVYQFHEIDENGEEISPQAEETQQALTVEVPEGESPAEYTEQLVLSDGSDAQERIWYAVDAEGEKTGEYDLEQPAEAEQEVIHLNTYRYQLTLLDPTADTGEIPETAETETDQEGTEAAVESVSEITETGNDLVIVANEGNTLDEAEFVQNGIDYTEWKWTDEQGSEVSLNALMTSGLTQNLILRANANSNDADLITGTVNFYALVDSGNGPEWTLVNGNSGNVQYHVVSFNGNNAYSLSAEQLEEVYGAYGFKASELSASNNMFWHSTVQSGNNATGSYTIWGDNAPVSQDGTTYIKLLNYDNGSTGNRTCNVFYLPNINSTFDSLPSSIDKEDSTLKAANTHYQLTINPNGIVSGDTTYEYIRKGDLTRQITLPELPTGYMWQFESQTNLNVPIGTVVSHSDSSITFELSYGGNAKVTEAMTLIPKKVSDSQDKTAKTMRYWISLNNTWTKIGEELNLAVSKVSYFYTASNGVVTQRTTYALPAYFFELYYEEYGYKEADAVAGESLFQNSSDGGVSIYSDRPAFEYDGTIMIPLLNYDGWTSADIYYMPNNKEPAGSKTADETKEANSFYKVSVIDPDHLVYADDTALPEDFWALRGTRPEVTLPDLPEGYVWSADGNRDLTAVSSENGQTTYKLISMGADVTLKPIQRTTTKKVNYWVSINDTWTLIGGEAIDTEITQVPYLDTGRLASAVPVSKLAEIYGAYGFKAEDAAVGDNLFRHSNGDPGSLYGNRPSVLYNGEIYYQLQNHTDWTVSNLYYLPADASDTSDSLSGHDRAQANSFYTVEVEDPNGLAFEDGELPEIKYVKRGDSVTVDLPILENGRKWIVDGAEVVSMVVNQSTNTVRYTIPNVSHQIIFRPGTASDTIRLRYVIEPDESEIANVSNTDMATGQQWLESSLPNVNGQQIYEVEINKTTGETHLVLEPSDTTAQTWKNFIVQGNKGNQYYTYSFGGWKINGDRSNRVNPDDELTVERLTALADENGEVTLRPIWNIHDESAAHPIESVGFYIRVDSTIADKAIDLDNDAAYTYNYKYSDSVFSTIVVNGENVRTVDQDSYNRRVIWPVDTAKTGIEANAAIRKLATEGYQTVNSDGTGTTVYLLDFPTDEEALAQLRTWRERDYVGHSDELSLDGQLIPTEMLNAKNFSIRWYVFKYDDSNGWHIDGLLVPKKGNLTVTKTFSGNAAAIEEIKNGSYSITAVSNREGEADIIMTLDGSGGTVAPTAYDETTNTYTWVLEVNQMTQYTIRENNYISQIEGMSTDAEYSVTNSENSSEDTNGYVPYVDETGAVVTGYAYDTDLNYHSYQTVALRNEYKDKNILTLRKIDAETGAAMPNVSFRYTDNSGDSIRFWYVASENMYYLSRPEDSTAVEITEGILTTDANGMIYLAVREGDTLPSRIILEEQTPEGYEPIDRIVLAVENGTVRVVGAPESIVDCDDTSITVANTPKKADLTVRKEWPDAEESEKAEVEVQLLANGQLLAGADYTQVLNKENGWTYTWKDLPLYQNGQTVIYTMIERRIGDTYYDSGADEDGFGDYEVHTGTLIYHYKDGSSGTTANTAKLDQLDHVSIEIRNHIYRQNITLTKTDTGHHPLAGAEFTLYRENPGKNQNAAVIETVVSTASGTVSFSRQKIGTYYLKETKAPDGYEAEDIIYVAEITKRGVTVRPIEMVQDNDGNKVEQPGTSVTEIQNEQTARGIIKIRKTDSRDDAILLAGAQFRLQIKLSGNTYQNIQEDGTTSDSSNNSIQVLTSRPVVTTGNSGTVEYIGLIPGDYQIEEIASPDGYYRLGTPVQFTVNNDGTITVQEDTNQTKRWSFETADDGSGTVILTIRNQAGVELPQTGGPGTIPFASGGILLMTAALLLIAKRNRCEGRGE